MSTFYIFVILVIPICYQFNAMDAASAENPMGLHFLTCVMAGLLALFVVVIFIRGLFSAI